MTPNPECATVDTPIVDALHTMHDGKFLHLPVLDKGKFMLTCEYIWWFQYMIWWVCMTSYILDADGTVVAVVDVIHITHAAVATVSRSQILCLELMLEQSNSSILKKECNYIFKKKSPVATDEMLEEEITIYSQYVVSWKASFIWSDGINSAKHLETNLQC